MEDGCAVTRLEQLATVDRDFLHHICVISCVKPHYFCSMFFSAFCSAFLHSSFHSCPQTTALPSSLLDLVHSTQHYMLNMVTTDIYLDTSRYSSVRGILCACVFLVRSLIVHLTLISCSRQGRPGFCHVVCLPVTFRQSGSTKTGIFQVFILAAYVGFDKL